MKPVALAANNDGPFIEPSKASFQNRAYPLTRSIFVFLNREPGKPFDPKLREFLRYILSREGQQDLVQQGEYLPLTPEIIREQLQKLH